MHRLAALAFLILTSLTCVRAQSTDASLTGRVTDTAKALIIDARVAAICEATNVRYETATNSSGEYYLGSLRPDVYRVEIEKTGFKKLIKPSILLHVQDNLEIDFDGTVIWNGTPVTSRAQLDQFFQSTAAKIPQPEVHLRPNRLAKYDAVARTLDRAFNYRINL